MVKLVGLFGSMREGESEEVGQKLFGETLDIHTFKFPIFPRFTMCAEEAGGNLTDCKELGLDNQAFEHVEECNTWDRDRCPR